MMWWLLICLSLLVIQTQAYHQSDYTIQMQRVQLMNYNRSYFSNASFGLVHYNRTYRAINFTLNLRKDLSSNLKISFQMYKFLSNEYRFFPITMEVNLCKEVLRDTFGLVESFKKSINFDMQCPIKKGVLRMTYGMFDSSKFPPYIPEGEFKGDIQLFDNSNFLLTLNVYAKIEEIIKKWEH